MNSNGCIECKNTSSNLTRNVFWAASALFNFVTIGADASNAFAEAPAPKEPLYVSIDKPYREWYKDRFPNMIRCYKRR